MAMKPLPFGTEPLHRAEVQSTRVYEVVAVTTYMVTVRSSNTAPYMWSSAVSQGICECGDLDEAKRLCDLLAQQASA